MHHMDKDLVIIVTTVKFYRYVLVPMVMLQQEHRVLQTVPIFAHRATTGSMVLRVLKFLAAAIRS